MQDSGVNKRKTTSINRVGRYEACAASQMESKKEVYSTFEIKFVESVNKSPEVGQ